MSFSIRALGSLALIGLLLVTCARVQAPPGGPEDKSPPVLLEATPHSGTLQVDRNEFTVHFLFDEDVDEFSVNRSLIVTPRPIKPWEIDISRKEVTLTATDTLRPGTTYVVTFSVALKDLRNNTLSTPIRLVYSTGDRIDSAVVTGYVADTLFAPARGWAVCAWRMTDVPDTLPFVARPPDAVTWTDTLGRFRLDFLAPGTYRLAGLADKNADLKWDLPAEPVALPTDDVTLAAGALVDGIWMRGSVQDTGRFGLLWALPINDTLVRAVFNQPIAVPDSAAAALRLVGDSLRDTIPVLGTWEDPARNNSLILRTHPLRTGQNYRLHAGAGFLSRYNATWSDDSAGARLNPAARDTTPILPSVLTSLKLPLRGVPTLELGFSVPVRVEPRALRTPNDSLNPEPLPGQTWRTRWSYRFPRALASSAKLPVTIRWRAFLAPGGTAVKDTETVVTLSAWPPDSVGAIEWAVDCAGRCPDSLRARLISLRADILPFDVPLSATGITPVRDLPGGLYRPLLWDDRDGDGLPDAGRLWPFVGAEPFRAWPDTLGVTNRWTVEDVKVKWGGR